MTIFKLLFVQFRVLFDQLCQFWPFYQQANVNIYRRMSKIYWNFWQMSKFLIISVVLVRLLWKSKAKKRRLSFRQFLTVDNFWLSTFPKYQKFPANVWSWWQRPKDQHLTVSILLTRMIVVIRIFDCSAKLCYKEQSFKSPIVVLLHKSNRL